MCSLLQQQSASVRPLLPFVLPSLAQVVSKLSVSNPTRESWGRETPVEDGMRLAAIRIVFF